MTAILNLIYCYLQEIRFFFHDLWLGMLDSLLLAVDGLLAAIDVSGLTLSPIPNSYAWVLGATGMAQAVAIIASALVVRFLLQSIPFVRWGS